LSKSPSNLSVSIADLRRGSVVVFRNIFTTPSPSLNIFVNVTVQNQGNIAALIDNLIESGEFAYSSRSEFVKDALRRFLEYHGHYPQSGISLEKSKITLNPSLLNEEADKVIADINAKIKMFQDLKNVLIREKERK
jgi:Arc/MetJ-type ribon-helix-helix transcriptional regulator